MAKGHALQNGGKVGLAHERRADLALWDQPRDRLCSEHVSISQRASAGSIFAGCGQQAGT
jgi:hypothetical protein